MATGNEVLLEVLATEGVEHVFGNPGSTELPFIDALADHPEIGYVLALQEATAVAMADGYAQVTRRPAFVNLHTSAGLGNAIGNLTNARANGTPLVVTAGNANRRHLVADPLLSGDLVGLARGTVKWGAEVHRAGDLGTILRRAFRDAATPPTGPVFVSIPMDVLEEGGADAPPGSPRPAAPVAGGLDALADLLAEGDVAIVAGEAVAASGALGEVVALAEALAAPVFGAPLYGALVFPTDHPLWRGMLNPRADAIRSALSPFRRVLVLGDQAFLVYPFAEGSPVPEGVEVLHLALDAHAPARTHPVRFGAAGDLRSSLAALTEHLAPRIAPATGALASHEAERRAEVDRFEATARSRYDQVPMHPQAAVHALLRALPRDIAVVDEAITTGVFVRGLHHTSRPDSYFFCRGGGLGWGMPAALGVSLGSGRAPVLCVVGDGSAMYAPQALWTAAREGIPVLFAVVNNREYAILKRNLAGMGGRAAATGRYVGLDLDVPPIDYVALARALGVEATRVDRAGEIGAAAEAAWASGAPYLLELPISAFAG